MQHVASKTIGRARTLAIGVGLATLVAACGGDSPGGPGEPTGPSNSTPIGAYSITTVNGKALPVAVFNEPSYKYEVTGGSLTLTSDRKYTVVTSFRQTIPGNVSMFTDSTFGTWSQSGAQINLVNGEDADAKDQGTWAGMQLTFALTDGKSTTTYVYTKR
jgi:hypothetical protein